MPTVISCLGGVVHVGVIKQAVLRTDTFHEKGGLGYRACEGIHGFDMRIFICESVQYQRIKTT